MDKHSSYRYVIDGSICHLFTTYKIVADEQL